MSPRPATPPPAVTCAPARLPRPAAVPDARRTLAAAIAWRLDRTTPAALRAETMEAATVRPGEMQ